MRRRWHRRSRPSPSSRSSLPRERPEKGPARDYSGFYYSKEHKARLWQPYGYERVLRTDDATTDVARYILENPIRAGLAVNVTDYPFLGSGIYTVAELMDYIQAGCSNPAKAGSHVV